MCMYDIYYYIYPIHTQAPSISVHDGMFCLISKTEDRKVVGCDKVGYFAFFFLSFLAVTAFPLIEEAKGSFLGDKER